MPPTVSGRESMPFFGHFLFVAVSFHSVALWLISRMGSSSTKPIRHFSIPNDDSELTTQVQYVNSVYESFSLPSLIIKVLFELTPFIHVAIDFAPCAIQNRGNM